MLKSIAIENFRCFEKTNISGFEQINLITGKNNSGKTALLEAIFFCLSPQAGAIIENSRQTPNDSDNNKNLCFNQRTHLPLSIECITNNFPSNSNLKLLIPNVLDAYQGESREHYQLQFIFDKNYQIPVIEDIAKFFDNEIIIGNSKVIHQSLTVIDEGIEEIRTFGSRQGMLYLRKTGAENYIPINYFGDAIQKIVRYIINILDLAKTNNKGKILLIDEIENGIHYTAQADVWRMLIKLCKHYHVQLFATTHSLEMIKAFQSVCLEEEFEGMGGYFELGRSAKTQQIIAVKHDLETLEYELATGDTIRGE